MVGFSYDKYRAMIFIFWKKKKQKSYILTVGMCFVQNEQVRVNEFSTVQHDLGMISTILNLIKNADTQRNLWI